MEAFFGLVAGRIVLALGSAALNAIRYVTEGQKLQLEEVNAMMRRIRYEFEHMQIFISNVDLQKHSATIEPWMKRAREIGESMEDVIDQYLYLRAEQSQAATCYYYMIAFDCCNILGSNPWSDIDTRLNQIETNLAHLEKMEVRYDIKSGAAGSSATPSGAAGSSATPAVAAERLDTANEDGITLFEKERDELIKWLTDDQAERAVIVVWGMGGLGKTTLVKNVYESQIIETHFICKAWVTVSSKYDLNGLLKQLQQELQRNYEERNSYMQDRGRLIEMVKNFLQKEKYLLVLDDVWTEAAFTDLLNIIPGNTLGSRVVVTTQLENIAKSPASKDRNMSLSRLGQARAWDLFCWEAFGKKGTDACPPELKETGEKIVKYCDGLPLAIVAIAKVMSQKGKTNDEWKCMLDKLSWEFNNNPSLESVKHVLNLSFDELPSHLKNCFLYCSFFPANGFERRKLIKLWIAESFIQERGSQTKEEVAEDFFKELVKRSMLQVVDRNWNGKVRRCQIPQVVRNITLSTASKERFSVVWKDSEPSPLGPDARRLSVHECDTKLSNLFKMDFSRIRSLFIFDHNSSTKGLLNSVSSTARYLRVIDLEKAEISKIPCALTGLFNLHYLGLRHTKVKRLPHSIGKLRNLQTLDLRYTKVEKLPKGVTQLKNLRHLLNEVYDESPRGKWRRFVRPLHGVWKLRSLQGLRMAVDETSVSRLGNLTALRTLKVSNVKQSHYRDLSNSLSLMTSLKKLTIIAADEMEVMQLLDLAPVFKKLDKLHLHGRLAQPVLPALQTTGLKLLFSRITNCSSGATPPRPTPREVKQQMGFCNSNDYNLLELWLRWSGLKDDPLPMICDLHKLTVLILDDVSDTEELRFENGWFPKLKEFHLYKFKNLKKIVVEKGALKSLERWFMIGLSKLMLLPKGIESLRALGILYVSECNPFFLYEIQGGHNHSVDHIRRIIHKYQADGGKWCYESLTRSRATALMQPAARRSLATAPMPPAPRPAPPRPPPLRPPPPRPPPPRPPPPKQPLPQGAEIEPQAVPTNSVPSASPLPQGAEIEPPSSQSSSSQSASPPHPALPQPAPPLVAPPQPREVPDNRVPSPSMRRTKSCPELPNSGSTLPDLNFRDPMLDEQQIGVAQASSKI